MPTFEDRVRASIRALADYAPSTDPPRVVPLQVPRHRTPVRAAVAVAAAITLVAVGAWVLSAGHPSKPVTVTTNGHPAVGTASLPSGPLPARSSEVTAWTGRQWLIWGGIENNNVQPDDGASYDPASGRWTMLPRAPLAGRQGAASVWTGKQWIIYGGSAAGRPFGDGASYDPTTNKWRRLPPGPLHDPANLPFEAVWTGTEMVVVADSGAAAYHPATRTWTGLPPVPGQSAVPGLSSSGTAVWTGTEAVVLLGSPDLPSSNPPPTPATTAPVPPTTPTTPTDPAAHLTDPYSPYTPVPYGPGYHLAAYSPRTDRWTPLPDGGLVGAGYPNLVWTGIALIAVNTNVNLASLPSGTAASYDVATRRWTRLPPPPAGISMLQGAAAWTGTSVVVWGGGPTVVTYTPSTGAWSTLTGTPRPDLLDPATVWTGTGLLVWGGLPSDLDGPGPPTEVTGAASYVPPKT